MGRAFALSALLCGVVAAQVTPSSGNAGGPGGPFDVFLVNGSAGGADRTVVVGLNQPITLAVDAAGTVPTGASFALFGWIGIPGPGDAMTLPLGIGTTAFPFCPLAAGHPLAFTVTDPFGLGCAPLLTSTPTPWSFTFPGFSFPFDVTIQGLILDPAGAFGVSVTNAVTARIIDDRVEVLYSKIGGHPTAIVPGATDTAGNPVVTEFRAFEQLVGSPDGTAWMLRGRTQQGSASETMMMLGGGATGTVFAQQGRPVHGGAPGEIYDFFGSGLGRFNDANDFIYSARAAGGVANTLQKVIRVVGGSAQIVLQQGSAALGLLDVAANVTGDELFGNSVGSAHLLNDNNFGVQDSTLTNIHTSRRPALFYNNVAFQQANVSTVVGLGGVGTETWLSPSANAFYTTPSGTRWTAAGTIVAPSTATDGVLVVDGQVVVREGSVIPGSSVTASTVLKNDVTSNGHWYARGGVLGGGSYAILNGVVVAKTGDPITPGSTETWTSFSAFAVDRDGDWVILGQTSAAAATDQVAVFNGVKVVAREGDPVDLDRNGLFDDDVFLGRGTDTLAAWSADNAFLTDENVLYFFVSLKNGAGADLTTAPTFSSPLAFLRRPIAAD